MCLTHRPRKGYYALLLANVPGVGDAIIAHKSFIVFGFLEPKIVSGIVLKDVDLVNRDGFYFTKKYGVNLTRQEVRYVVPLGNTKDGSLVVTDDAFLGYHSSLFNNRTARDEIKRKLINAVAIRLTVPVIIPEPSIMAVDSMDVVSKSYGLFTEETIGLFRKAVKGSRMRRAIVETFVRNALWLEKVLKEINHEHNSTE